MSRVKSWTPANLNAAETLTFVRRRTNVRVSVISNG